MPIDREVQCAYARERAAKTRKGVAAFCRGAAWPAVWAVWLIGGSVVFCFAIGFVGFLVLLIAAVLTTKVARGEFRLADLGVALFVGAIMIGPLVAALISGGREEARATTAAECAGPEPSDPEARNLKTIQCLPFRATNSAPSGAPVNKAAAQPPAPAKSEPGCNELGLTGEACINHLYPPGPPPPAQPTDGSMRFELADTGSNHADWIAAQGTIDTNTPSYFEAFLTYWGPWIAHNYPNGFTVRLNSPGGDLGAGLALGELIRQHHLSTEVGATQIPANAMLEVSVKQPGHCNSSCAWSFLGGVTRSAGENELGVHRFGDSPEVPEALRTGYAQQTDGLILHYLKRMGIDPEVLFIAAMTPFDHILLLDEATMIELRIVTVEPPLSSPAPKS
jgi:hypothetical protein